MRSGVNSFQQDSISMPAERAMTGYVFGFVMREEFRMNANGDTTLVLVQIGIKYSPTGEYVVDGVVVISGKPGFLQKHNIVVTSKAAKGAHLVVLAIGMCISGEVAYVI